MPSPEELLIQERKEKLASWIAVKGNPYQEKFSPQGQVENIYKSSASLGEGERSGTSVRIAGRVTAQRTHGKATFFDLKDGTGKLQLYGRLDKLGDNYALLAKIDIGDIIGVEGEIFKTRTGELTIELASFTLLAKSLHPLPEKWHGLQDVELRYRKRWLDLLVNPKVRENVFTRAKVIRLIRNFLDSRGFVEVETPIMQPLPGGATARPFKTYHNALSQDFYLRIAPELYLKRLIVGGLEKVYELSRNFRNEGIDRFHNPEFTMLEVYQAYVDYVDVMEFVQNLVLDIAKEIKGNLKIQYDEQEIDLSLPWNKLTFMQALQQIGGVDVHPGVSDQELRAVADKCGMNTTDLTRSQILEHLLDKKVVPYLIQPTIIYDYPFETAPLAKKKKENPLLVERFELFIGGWELANAYSELNDAQEQRERMKKFADSKFVDYDFLESLEYAMPPAGGLGIGIDRLVMLITNSTSIREVILFPQLKSKITDSEKEEY